MFEGIPSRPRYAPSQRMVTATFSFTLAIFMVGITAAYYRHYRWHRPFSLSAKMTLVDFIVGATLSTAFLLTAKSTTPEGNGKRMSALWLVVLVLQVIADVLRP